MNTIIRKIHKLELLVLNQKVMLEEVSRRFPINSEAVKMVQSTVSSLEELIEDEKKKLEKAKQIS